MKKIIISTITIILAFLLCISASAEKVYLGKTIEFDGSILKIGETTVTFAENSTFSTEEKEHIASIIAFEASGEVGAAAPKAFNLICSIFGHNYETEYVTAITHRVRDTQPRCLEELFEISKCSRCGNTTTDRISSVFITCCP